MSQLQYFIFKILNFLYFCFFISLLNFRYFLNRINLALFFAVIIRFWLLTYWESIDTLTIALRWWIIFRFWDASSSSLFSQLNHVDSFQFSNVVNARLSFLEFELLFQYLTVVYCALVLLYLAWEFSIYYQGLFNLGANRLRV